MEAELLTTLSRDNYPTVTVTGEQNPHDLITWCQVIVTMWDVTMWDGEPGQSPAWSDLLIKAGHNDSSLSS